jgi:DNA uptake protein ComE-like DNA-binding protein
MQKTYPKSQDPQARTRNWHSGPTEEGQSVPASDVLADVQGIDFNHATFQQLLDVEGMSEEVAQRIIECRTFEGHFRTWEELRRIPGMSDELLRSLQQSARIGGTESGS